MNSKFDWRRIFLSVSLLYFPPCVDFAFSSDTQPKSPPQLHLSSEECIDMSTGENCIKTPTLKGPKEAIASMRLSLAEGCEKGRYEACETLGEMEHSQGNEAQAVSYYHVACDHGRGTSCARVAAILEKQDKGNDQSSLFMNACEKRDPGSCVLAGIRLLLRAEDKNKIMSDTVKYFRKACPGPKDETCTEWGVRAQKAGRAQQAYLFFRAGCENGNQSSCSFVKLFTPTSTKNSK